MHLMEKVKVTEDANKVLYKENKILKKNQQVQERKIGALGKEKLELQKLVMKQELVKKTLEENLEELHETNQEL